MVSWHVRRPGAHRARSETDCRQPASTNSRGLPGTSVPRLAWVLACSSAAGHCRQRRARNARGDESADRSSLLQGSIGAQAMRLHARVLGHCAGADGRELQLRRDRHRIRCRARRAVVLWARASLGTIFGGMPRNPLKLQRTKWGNRRGSGAPANAMHPGFSIAQSSWSSVRSEYGLPSPLERAAKIAASLHASRARPDCPHRPTALAALGLVLLAWPKSLTAVRNERHRDLRRTIALVTGRAEFAVRSAS